MLKYLLITISVLIVWALAALAIHRFLNKETDDLKIIQLEISGIKIEAEVADNFLSRMQGLSGRESLGEGKGMLFIFNGSAVRSFWMKDMNFPIDIIWIKDDEIVGFVENAPIPEAVKIPSFRSPSDVDKALELNAGSVKKFNIQIGDKIKY